MLPNFTTRTPQTPPAKTENLTTNLTPKQLTVQAKKAKRTAVDTEPESEEDRNNEEDAKTEEADSQTMPSRKTETDDDSESEMYEPDSRVRVRVRVETTTRRVNTATRQFRGESGSEQQILGAENPAKSGPTRAQAHKWRARHI